jgi:hypothetical protein
MSDAEPPPAMEVATLTTPDVMLGEDYKDIEAIEGQKDYETCYGGGGSVIVANELVGISEDPNQPDIATADEPEEGADVEGQTNDISAAVSTSKLVDDPMEVGMQTEVSAAADDLIEVGAALVSSAEDCTAVAACLVNDDCNIIFPGGVHRSDDQTDQEFGGNSLDADEVALLVNDIQDDNARMDMDVSAHGDVHAQDRESSQLDVATALLNEVGTELVEAGDHAVQECTNMDMRIQAGDDNEAERVGTIADTATNEEHRHMGEVTMTRDDSEKHDVAGGVDVPDERIQMGRGGLPGDDNEQKEVATADEDRVEDEGMQVDAVNITGDMVEEGRIAVEYIAGEAVIGEGGIDVPEEKAAQIDRAGNDIPEEEGLPMGEAGLIGSDNGLKEAVIADHDGVEVNAIPTEATATTNDDDENNTIVGEDVAEAVNDITGDDVPDEEAAHMEDDDDDEPPPLVEKKGGGRRKRGRPSSKVQGVVKPSVKRKDEEEVCFICFDGGDLVICDRRFVHHMEFLYSKIWKIEHVTALG